MKLLPSILIALLAFGDTLRGTELTPDTVVSIALAHHPQLQAIRFDIQAAQARSIDAGRLPNPEIELSARRSQATAGDREGSVFAGLTQRFPITGRLRRTRQVRQIEVDLAHAELEDAERLLVAEVLSRFVRSQATVERVSVMEDLVGRMEGYVKLAEQRLANAQGSDLDVAAARTEALLAHQATRQAEFEVREAFAALRPLLGMRPGAEIRLAGGVVSTIAKLQESVRLTVPGSLDRTDVTAAKVSRERAEIQQRLVDAERWEDWEVAIGYENERSVDEPLGAERDHFFGIGLRIPLPLRRRSLGRIAEARAEAAKADQILRATQAASLAEVANGIEAVRKAEALARSLSQETLPLIEEREQKTREAYAQGLIDFTPVLQLQQQQTQLRESLLESRRDHALALVRLQAAMGSHPRLNFQPNKQ
ncbi:MAG TPA: TolC family protein [Verrucomicrobiales bacterium]|nr:TolC family protein [Verrucomicrobiales bacterium]